MTGAKQNYYSISFGSGKTYWYRSNSNRYRAGVKVIAPVSNNGLWKIGTIMVAQTFPPDEVPYPLDKTKSIVEKAGLFAQAKVDKHNRLINEAQYPPIDISVSTIETDHGRIRYCTCAHERELSRREYKR